MPTRTRAKRNPPPWPTCRGGGFFAFPVLTHGAGVRLPDMDPLTQYALDHRAPPAEGDDEGDDARAVALRIVRREAARREPDRR